MAQKNVGKKKKRKASKRGLFIAFTVVIVMAAIVSVKSKQLKRQEAIYMQKQQEMQKKIDDEKVRSEELSEYKKYVETNDFIEQMAKEKLGLVQKDEIIFKGKK